MPDMNTAQRFPLAHALVQDTCTLPAGEYFLRSKNKKVIIREDHHIGRCTVTVAQYREYCEATNKEMPPAPPWGWIDNHPIVNVSWHDARRYCAWVYAVTGVEIDLPDEVVWEAAAAGPEGKPYPWGDEWDASKCVNSASRTGPVDSHPEGASWIGCLNMSGNVWEWLKDRYYRKNPQE